MWPTFYIPGLARGESDLQLVDYVTLGCFTHTVIFTPQTQVPAARAGDLFVLVVHSDFQSANNNFCTCSPDTFERFLWSSQTVNNVRDYGGTPTAVLYKVLTQADLSTTFTITHGGGTGSGENEICVRGYVFREFDPDIPLDCFSFNFVFSFGSARQRMASALGSSASNVVGDYQFCIASYQLNTGNSGDARPSTLVQLSPPLNDNWHSSLSQQGGGRVYHIDVGVRLTTDPPTNLLDGESVSVPLSTWTGTGLNSNSVTGGYRSIVSNGTNTTHFLEKEVTLTAGQNYSWHVMLRRSTNRQDSTGVMVVPPTAANEFGVVDVNNFNNNGSIITATLDPLGTHGTSWYGACPDEGGDGLPNDVVHPVSVFFTAAETGTHKLRIYVGNGTSVASLTHTTSGRETNIISTALYEEFCAPMWTPSTLDVPYSRLQKGPVYYINSNITPFTESDGSGAYSFVVNRNRSSLVPAVMLPYAGTGLTKSPVTTSGLRVDGYVFATDYGGAHVASRPVYPKISGVAQKYYAEIEIHSISGAVSARHSLEVGPLHGSFADNENVGALDGRYAWERNGQFVADGASVPSSVAWSLVAGDRIGVLVDYTNNTVVFSKNGVTQGTLNIRTTSGLEHQKLPFMLYVQNCDTFTGANFSYTAHLASGFSYKPSGALAWDWKNA